MGSLFAGSVCLPGFDLAPRHFSDLRLGPVNACHLTMRAADLGYAPANEESFTEVGRCANWLASRPKSANAGPLGGFLAD